MIKAYAAPGPGKSLEPFEFDPGPLRHDEVEIQVEYCGICHSDLSMWINEWGQSQFPLVPGHEVVGRISAAGESVRHLSVGNRVGLGWWCRSCLVCDQCLSGHHHRCQQVPLGSATIVGRHGGFADKVRCQAPWAFPLSDGVEPRTAGPLFCGGATVFAPFVENDIRPTDMVAVVGIGGLGHMALRFAHAWGCEVTAFSTSPDKEAEARQLGAHHFVASRDPAALRAAANCFDMVLVTVNAQLDWDAYVNTLRPGGKLHIVGAVANVNVAWFPMLVGDRSIGGSPVASPATIRSMLEFCARHQIQPITEEFPMSQVNDALERLRTGSPRYRIVLRVAASGD